MDKQEPKTSGTSVIRSLGLIFRIMMILLSWSALILQCYLMLINREVGLLETMIRFFSFFTILTNLLVALSFSLPLLAPGYRLSKFMAGPQTFTAIVVYIIVVSAVYNMFLRNLWRPEGMQYVVDLVLHTILPALTVLFWIVFIDKRGFRWAVVIPWLWYPLIYCLMILLAGSVSGFYPYPFMNVTTLGYPIVLLICVALAGVFLVLSLIIVAITKLLNWKQENWH